MFGADKGTVDSNSSRMNGKKLTIGIVQARFNESVTNALAQACKAELIALGVPEKHIDLVSVPGALEIPVALITMAEKLKYDALIALGSIIRGETYHFELVANESGAGVTRVSLDYQLPIANAILTTENMVDRRVQP
jgi:6,7-dimethyl-8-ribityllumazine synthase